METYKRYTKPAELDKAINTLRGILTGIKADGVIQPDEVQELANWCVLHQGFEDCHPFSEILPVVHGALSDGVLTQEKVDDVLWVCDNMSRDNPVYNTVTASLQTLQGLLHGVLADGKLNDDEILSVANWIEGNDFLAGTYPYDEINSLLTTALADKVISDDERNMLLAYFSNFVDTTMSYNLCDGDLKQLRSQYTISGICAVCPEIIIPDRHFCFTGDSRKATRKELGKLVVSLGGLLDKSVTLKTDYLVVGNGGNPCWAFACYGRKVEKAIELRKNGGMVQIVNETDFWDTLQDFDWRALICQTDDDSKTNSDIWGDALVNSEILDRIEILGKKAEKQPTAKISELANIFEQQGSAVLTGELSICSRNETKHILEALGLRVSGSLSKKTSFLLVGSNVMQEKIDRATAMGIPIVAEDDFWSAIYLLYPKT